VSYVDANGVHTSYEEHGTGDPLLLLHGGLADASGFTLQTPAFAERYRVVVPDRRGHGRIELYETIPDAQLAVIPGASHVAPIEKPDLVNQLVLDFLSAEGPPATMMPLRRREQP
jgi:pimeloyl-ACP methyl ester carboxylesterase